MTKKNIYILFIVIVLMMAGCAKDNGPVVISVEETPTRANIITQEPTSTPTPTPEVTEAPTIEPTVLEESFVYIEDLELDDGDSTMFLGKWTFGSRTVPFTIGSQSYNKGIGMFVKSRNITDKVGSVESDWKLEKDYYKMSFDMGCERSLQYDVEEKYGTYSITIYTDGEKIWDSGFHDYKYAESNVEVDIPKDAKMITVKLSQTKGISGTLNVIMGSVKLYYSE